LIYPINYGYIPGVLGGDCEELDVFLIGVHEPVEAYTGQIIGIVYRADDVEDKLVMAPIGQSFTAAEIADAVYFQEKYYQTTIRALDGSQARVR
jgi:inorganic pyrophosphatase